MTTNGRRRALLPLLALLTLATATEAWAGRWPGGAYDATRVRFWNTVALTASAVDHTNVMAGGVPVFGTQLGPTRTSRALAIVQIAVFDAVNAIDGGYQSYTGIAKAPAGASLDAAVGTAAHDTLVALYPAQGPALHMLLALDLAMQPGGHARADGVATGRRAAAAILALRADDGSDREEPVVGVDYFPGDGPGEWRPDPVSQSPIALGAWWYEVRPFVMTAADQFRVPPPPALDSAEYAAAFEEVKLVGGDGVVTPTLRTPEETVEGIYWGYDGTPLLGAPPRMYNQIAVQIAAQRDTDGVRLARLLALLNTAMADACLAVWETKYVYRFWRPVTAIREADGDGNPATDADPTFTPLGAPASNLVGQPDFTPPFPAYPSGHAGIGGAAFEVLRAFYGTDAIAFTFVSDEYNGHTRDNDGHVRPRLPDHYASLTEAEAANAHSRILLGIHWAFDASRGLEQGHAVARWTYANAFRPVR
jgi:hypothetical protein